MANAINILVVGAGMYVCGKHTEEPGVVMPAIFEWSKENFLGKVYIAATSLKSVRLAKSKISQLKRRMGLAIPITYFPEAGIQDNHCYRQAMRMIPKPAICIVATPDALHKEVASAAIREGMHTLVVKPLASKVKDLYELIKLQEKNNVYCAVEFHKRLDHANLKLKDILRQGLIGEPLYFLVEFSQRKTIPEKIFLKWVTQTNVFQYLGVHYVDIIHYVTAARPIRAMAIGQKNWLFSKGINAYDSIQGIIEWRMPSGRKIISYILTNWIDPEATSALSDQKIKVIGTKGRFESDQKKRGITIVNEQNGVQEPNLYFCSSYGIDEKDSFYGYGITSICQFFKDVVQLENALVTVNELENKRPTFKQSLEVTKVIEGINNSLKNHGAWVDL